MERELFNALRAIIQGESGIALTDSKMELLENRLLKRLRALSLTNVEDYLQILHTDSTGVELSNLIDAVSTNVTFFFREESHFVRLESMLDSLIRSGKKNIKIWCAAASSGEEPYTIAMVAAEKLKGKKIDIKILATDICMPVLEQAACGVYGEEQVAKVPSKLLDRYFRQIEADGSQGLWQVVPELKNMVLFKKLNLAEMPYPLRGPIDVIFCRNVMIYFDRPLRERIVAEFYNLLVPGGSLFLSHSENMLGVNHRFEGLGQSIFIKPTLVGEARV